MKGKTLDEFDYIANVIHRMLISAFFIGLGSYITILGLGTNYLSGIASLSYTIIGIVLFVFGFLIYALSECGKDFILGTLNKKNNTGKQSINKHLGMGWAILVGLNFFVVLMPKSSIIINTKAILDLSTAIIISISILAVLMVDALYKLGKNSMILFNNLLLALILPILVMLFVIFNIQNIFTWGLLDASLAALFSFFGLFIYYFKVVVDKSEKWV